MLKASVRLGARSYPVLIGRDLLARVGQFIRQSPIPSKNVLIVSQEEITSLYAEPLNRTLTREGYAVSWFIPSSQKSSEAAKSEATFARLIKKIAGLDGRNKSPFLIALGGGVVGDLTGFAASIYRRGIPYIQIPTTLTAQVDSAIGGKTGIDLPEGKNLLGSIYQPSLVLSDMNVLQSLPDRHWSDGFAEVIKYGVIRDASLFYLLEKKGLTGLKSSAPLLEKVIYKCARIKADIVSKDEFDKKDFRIVLNFGHTAGHAIENVSGYSNRYTHGEAVAIGMLVACDIAKTLGVLKDAGLAARLETTLIKFNLPVYYKNLDTEKILEAVGYDKKSLAGVSRFVLPEKIGRTRVVRDVPVAVIREALKNRRR